MSKDSSVSKGDKELLKNFFDANIEFLIHHDFDNYQNLEDLINRLKSYMKKTSSLENNTLLTFLRDLINQVNIIKIKVLQNSLNGISNSTSKTIYSLDKTNVLSNSTVINRWVNISEYKIPTDATKDSKKGYQRTMSST